MVLNSIGFTQLLYLIEVLIPSKLDDSTMFLLSLTSIPLPLRRGKLFIIATYCYDSSNRSNEKTNSHVTPVMFVVVDSGKRSAPTNQNATQLRCMFEQVRLLPVYSGLYVYLEKGANVKIFELIPSLLYVLQ